MPRQEYSQNGRPVPGVTTILGQQDKPGLIAAANSLGLRGVKVYGDDPVGTWTHAANVGTATHALIEAHINRSHCDYTVAPQNAFVYAQPCFETFLKWSEGKSLAGKTEMSLVHPALGFGGTMDLLADDGTIYDWKTSGAGFDTENLWCQLAAYRELAVAHKHKVLRCVAVNFPKDGKGAKEIPLTVGGREEAIARDLFLALLDAYALRLELIESYKAQKKLAKSAGQGRLL